MVRGLWTCSECNSSPSGSLIHFGARLEYLSTFNKFREEGPFLKGLVAPLIESSALCRGFADFGSRRSPLTSQLSILKLLSRVSFATVVRASSDRSQSGGLVSARAVSRSASFRIGLLWALKGECGKIKGRQDIRKSWKMAGVALPCRRAKWGEIHGPWILKTRQSIGKLPLSTPLKDNQ